MRALLLCVLLVSCGSSEPHHPTKAEETDIERACSWFRAHGCEEGDSTPAGASCEEVFTNAAQKGIPAIGDVECIVHSTDCEQAAACP